MEDFLQEKPKRKKHSAVVFRGYRRLFVLVFAVAVLWQAVSLLQKQLSAYHGQMVHSFKVILTVVQPQKNDVLAALQEEYGNYTYDIEYKPDGTYSFTISRILDSY